MSGAIMKMAVPTVAEQLTRHILYLDPRSPDYAKNVFASVQSALKTQDATIAQYRDIITDGAHLRPPAPIMICGKCGKDLSI